ncbi:hypothetical protein VNI00_014003 [Paramarasmius palmivorus]|uniref:Uncharacterized protein n=1 Tax=Paramarasmius palmivorus TaxID=297713 RepID=A0AAW0BW54_9AGAR
MVAVSPRQTPRKAKHITPGAPKERRCNRCPDRPLLRECAHSAQARKTSSKNAPVTQQSLASQVSSPDTPVLEAPPLHPQARLGAHLLLNQNLQDILPLTPSQHRRVSVEDIPIDPALQASEQPASHELATPTRPQSPPYTQTRPRPQSPPYTQRRPNEEHLSLEELASDDDQPSNLCPDRSSPAGPRQSNLTFVNLNSQSARFSSSSVTSAASTPSASRSGSSRIRVSQKNQPYGRIKGAMRGNLEWNVPRRREVEPYDLTRENRTKQFQLRMARILQRCEEVANVTGCWLYISSQIATSNHGFVHFASDALIRDADQRMNDLHAFHSNMHTALSRATVRDVAQVEMENVQVRAQLAEAKESEAAARQSVSEMQKKLDEQERKLARILELLPSADVNESAI